MKQAMTNKFQEIPESPPHAGGRGLKQLSRVPCDDFRRIAPPRGGARIETISGEYVWDKNEIAPPRGGARIETGNRTKLPFADGSPPHAGGRGLKL